jgi:K(+)-stimulated pyrophosphate-energized sodium pump
MKDTAGPALNPLIKVINLVAVIFASVLAVEILPGQAFRERDVTPVMIAVAIVGIIVIIGAFWFSRKQESFGRESDTAAEPAVEKKR